VRAIFDEQVAWAAEASVDLVIAETISWVGEAQIALESIRAAGLPAVVTMTIHQDVTTRDGYTAAEACRALAGAGADVVGLNCCRGPSTMLPLIAEIVDAVDVPVAALPVPYRTTPEQPTFQSLRDPAYDGYPTGQPFPTGLDPFTCTRYELADFARAASELGARYLGVCCGAGPHHIRAVAEVLGRTPEASRYTEDMSKHAYFGTDPALQRSNQNYAARL
jgi:betaine-homocysteine S-methyltransferase